MTRLFAIDDQYTEELKSIQEMKFTAQDRRDLETAFEELTEPYWVSGSTAYIKVRGPLCKRWSFETWLLGGYPTPYLQHIFQKAEADSQVEQIMLLVDSPGGEVSGLSEFAQVVRECSKPVHAHISGHCTSGAYWLASQADRITGSKTSMVGSIGAFISFIKLKDSPLFEEVTFRSSKHKAPDPESKEGKEDYQNLVDGIAELFEADVAEGRGVTVEQVRASYGQGKVFLGTEAQDLGLIDEVINKSELVLEPAQASDETIYAGGSMKVDKQKETEAAAEEAVVQEPAGKDSARDAAAVERDRIKGIIALGGSDELTTQAIDEGMSVEEASLKVNAELQTELKRLSALADRAEDAQALDQVPQEPAGEVQKPTPTKTEHQNIFGVKASQIDQEIEALEKQRKGE